MQLICPFVFVCAKSRFSHDVAHTYLLYLHHPFETTFLQITMFLNTDLVILLHSKSLKKCHRKYGNRFTNKSLTPKNNLDLWKCCQGKSLFSRIKIKFLIFCFKYNKSMSNIKIWLNEVQTLEQSHQIC